MSVKQISVFIENRQGALEKFTRLLGENGIDLNALSMADTTNFGILRAIVNEPAKALQLVKDHGYTANLTDVLAVAVPDSPGGLTDALEALTRGNVSIEYLYSLVRRVGEKAVIIFRVDKPDEAAALLAGAHVELLSHQAIAQANGH
ncbi:MAG: acetolactate synthase [Ruminococcaceae bacterium]|nr:acetolactate synthase [Oscillospiraceae bacterium]